MRIVTLSDQFPPNDPGGAQEIARRVSVAYRDAGHEVSVITSRDPAALDHGNVEGLPVSSLPTQFGVENLESGLEISTVTRLLVEQLENTKADLVHAHNVHSALGWAWIPEARRLGMKIILTFHDHMAFTRGKFVPPPGVRPNDSCRHTVVDELLRFRMKAFPFRAGRIRNLAAMADHRTAVSRDLVRRLDEHHLPNVEAIHNGIDDGATAPTTFSEKPSLIFLGRPTAEKGLDALITALSALDHPVRVNLTGDLSLDKQSQLRKRVGDQVTLNFTGWIDAGERTRLIDESWAVVNLSTYPDPFNLTNLEGMVRARPILGTRWGGTPEIVEDGRTGWLVDAREPVQVLRALTELLSDRGEAERRGQMARQHVLDHFLWKDRLARYLELATELVG